MPKESLGDVNVGQRLDPPRSRGVQRQDVWDAADAVLLQGDKPTIERVRQYLGSGSPNTVGPHLDQWFRQLGKRLNDTGTFGISGASGTSATPHGVPDPVLQAAQHLWETALAQTRSDFDERLQAGLKASASAVEAEKERAELAAAAADEATARAARLERALGEMEPVLSQAREDLAAQHARLDEVRGAWALVNNQLKEEKEARTKEIAELKQQLLSAVDRADAADRRVALELDRERTTRARAERQAEALQKSLEAAQAAALAASEHARQTQKDLGEREDSLKVHLATAMTELNEERQRVKDLRADGAVKALEASEARAQAKGLQHALDRLSKLVQGDRPERWRAAKTFVPKKKI